MRTIALLVVYLCNDCVLVLGSGANVRLQKQKKGNENNALFYRWIKNDWWL
jgi:hypothetical protein